VNRGAAKLAVEGVAWFDKHVEGLPAPKGDDIYTLFGKTSLHSFIKWVGDLFTIKTPELRRQTIVAAMYGTFENNEDQARRFCRKRGFLALDKLAHPAARPRGKSCRRPSTLANATTV
jgi:hypothetical protein